MQARLVTTVVLPLVTAADISADGERLVLGTYGPACIIQRRGDGAWSGRAEGLHMVPLPARRQGEAVCFDRQAARLLLTSEGTPPMLWEVDLLPQAGSADPSAKNP